MKWLQTLCVTLAGLAISLPASAFAVKFRPGMVLKGYIGTVTFQKPGLLVRQAEGFVLRFEDGDCRINLLTLDVSGESCEHISVEKSNRGDLSKQ